MYIFFRFFTYMEHVCIHRFHKERTKKLTYLNMHFENTYGVNINDILPIISKYMIFSCKDHIGGVVPIYYHFGLPSRVWTCVICGGLVEDKELD